MATKSTTLHPGTMARQIKENSSGGGVSPEVIQELEEDVERALLGNHVYSTTERVCGVWVDGSNIYEKTILFDSPLALMTGYKYNIDNIVLGSIDVMLSAIALQSKNGKCSTYCNYYQTDREGKNIRATVDINADVLVLKYVKSE